MGRIKRGGGDDGEPVSEPTRPPLMVGRAPGRNVECSRARTARLPVVVLTTTLAAKVPRVLVPWNRGQRATQQ